MKFDIKFFNKPIFYFLFGIIVMYFLLEIKRKCFIKNNSKEMLNEIINKLVRQSSRWSTAAQQDDSPLIAVLHANYGSGYLWALKDIASSDEIEEATGIDYFKYEKEITDVQDSVTRNLIKVCPNFAPKPSYLTKLSGEGI